MPSGYDLKIILFCGLSSLALFEGQTFLHFYFVSLCVHDCAGQTAGPCMQMYRFRFAFLVGWPVGHLLKHACFPDLVGALSFSERVSLLTLGSASYSERLDVDLVVSRSWSGVLLREAVGFVLCSKITVPFSAPVLGDIAKIESC